MHRNLVVLLAAVVVAGAAGAYFAGRAMRPAARAPDSQAASVRVETIETTRWKLADLKLPDLARSPKPTATASPSGGDGGGGDDDAEVPTPTFVPTVIAPTPPPIASDPAAGVPDSSPTREPITPGTGGDN